MSKNPKRPTDDDTLADLNHLASDLKRSAIEVAWRQWRALDANASSAGARKPLQSLVDPEALLLFSLLMRDEEPRFDEVLPAWVASNSGLISIQRIKNLIADYSPESQAIISPSLARIARVAVEDGKDFRWKSLLTQKRVGSELQLAQQPAINRSSVARLVDPVALLLRLRFGIGVGVKADLICFLLSTSDEWMTVRRIAYATGYTAAGVRRAADDLAAARFLRSNDQQPAAYRTDRQAWQQLLRLDSAAPTWQNWRYRFAFVAAVDAWTKHAEGNPLSSYAFSVRGRKLIDEYREVFYALTPFSSADDDPTQDGPAFVRQNMMILSARMTEWA
jgi:hypothetical protein